MSKSVKWLLCIILIFLTVFSPIGSVPSAVTAYAATYNDLNSDAVFLKQKTAVTCTLSSAAMLMRRTAICAGDSDWKNITENSIRDIAWVNGLGLLWSYTCYNITVGHGYFQSNNKKTEMLNLLEKYPQGIVIYNGGNKGQSHAVLLCDYDKNTDTFYVADPASNAPEGRIPFIKSTILGKNQQEQIENISAYWYVESPVITVNNGNYTATSGNSDAVNNNLAYFDSNKENINAYYVVTDDSAEGSAIRTSPSGNGTLCERVKKGTILNIECVGKNISGALWYRTESGYYIFSNNITSFEKYSSEIEKYNSTASNVKATYTVNSTNDTRTPLRLEPAEGNNIVAYVNNGKRLYVTHSGVNSVGAIWLKTEEGYYVKASQMKFESSTKFSDAKYDGEYTEVTGYYSSVPVKDVTIENLSKPEKYKTTASALNVRSTAVNGNVIGLLSKGTVVEVIAILDGWGKISYNGKDGWISLDYAEKIVAEPTPIKINEIKLDKNMVAIGSSIDCTVNVISDVSCMYKFSVYSISGERVHAWSQYLVGKTYTYEPDKAGIYYFEVEVCSTDGRTLFGYSSNFTVFTELKIGSVKNDSKQYSYVNDQITWTVETVSVSESAVYKYAMYFDGALLFEKESLSDKLSYKPEKQGTYVLKVYIEDEFSTSEIKTGEAVRVYDILKIDSITMSATSVVKNKDVVVGIKASGGAGSYMYLYSVFRDDKLIKNGAYTTLNENRFAFNESGSYKIYCTVKDTTGSVVSAFSRKITVYDQLPGDVDSDGSVTAADARLVLRFSAGIDILTPEGILVADVDRDGNINAADARYILRCAANLETI